jgi:hypothetical protein
MNFHIVQSVVPNQQSLLIVIFQAWGIAMKIQVIVLIGCLMLTTTTLGSETQDFSNLIKKHTSKIKLVQHIIKKESTGKSKVRNKQCIGLMQINSKVWLSKDPKYNLIKLGIIQKKSDLLNPEHNIRAGIYILKHYKYDYKRYRGTNGKRKKMLVLRKEKCCGIRTKVWNLSE